MVGGRVKKIGKTLPKELIDNSGKQLERLDTKPALLDLKNLESKNIYYFGTVDSTNLIIRRLAAEGAPNFSTAVAEEQQEGRGRLGRSWFSPRGTGLWFSMLLRPDISNRIDITPVTLVTAAVLANYFREVHNLPVLVKWPNDLLLSGKKIGGTLTEIIGIPDRPGYLVTGIGLNINQQEIDFPGELRLRATSLALESGNFYNRTELFLAIKETLEKAYRLFFSEGFPPFQKLWKKHSSTLGQDVTLSWTGGTMRGKALDLSKHGELLLQDEQGKIHTVNYGELI